VDETCNACQNATEFSTSNITSTGATLNWVGLADPEQWQLRYKTTNQGSQWTQLTAIAGTARSFVLSSLKKNQNYNWQIRARCSSAWTAYSISASFKTGSSNSSSARAGATGYEEPLDLAKEFSIYPNPARERFVLTLRVGEILNTTALIHIKDINGKIILTENARMNDGSLKKVLSTPPALASGVYIIQVLVGNKTYYTKLLHQK
jgi:hypothetical protein